MEVILSDLKNHPMCPHGPCLLFERHTSSGSKTGRRFFACSACRDNSECSFFQWADEEISKKRKELWEILRKEKRPPFSHEECMKRLNVFKSLPDDKKKYCKTCSLLILNHLEKHSNHDTVNVSSELLLKPSSVFIVHDNKKVEAQYFFKKTTVNFLISLIKDLGFSKLALIGVPKIHEFVASNQNSSLSSFLMDIDQRYMQFFSPEQFCHYNLFNNYFFGGKESKKHFKNFLCEKQDEKLLLIIDPPFGGLVDAISYTLKKINKWWQKQNNKSEEFMPVMWIFPFFQKGRILKNLPNLKMMDYKVEYENHKKFGKSDSKNSPVRIFTNIEASHFVLPSEYGYRFCDKCERYVSEENQHCSKCNACTTKHGKSYRHCDHCQQCVKSSYIHCQKCNKCNLPSSKSTEICQKCECEATENGQQMLEKCFKCKAVGHRKRDCPVTFRNAKRRKHKV